MRRDFRFEWRRDQRVEIVEIAHPADRFVTPLKCSWAPIERPLAEPTRHALLRIDGIIRGWAGASFASIAPPANGFEPVDSPVVPGKTPWLIGAGLEVADWTGDDARSQLVENMRVLLGYERSCSGVIVATRFAGWKTERPGGERHYLQMVEYGSRRDPLLELYLKLGFWFVGRHPSERIAYLAKRLET